jgi:3-phenylpropionate/trans-cinnamate dioxygenase ferredoxin reductase subunit
VDNGPHRIVVVGASLAGGTATATLREEGFDGELTLIGAEPHPPYERPPLSKSFLRSETPFEDALVRSEDFYKENDIDTRFGVAASGLDVERRTVTLAEGDTVPFDRLLVATGARNRRFAIPGIELKGVYGLRTVEDCERIRGEIGSGRRAVVAGMGFIGSEVTASLRQRGVEVTAVDGGSVPLERILGEEVGAALRGLHLDHGVKLISRDRVEAFEGSDRVERVITRNGHRLECDFAVVGLGVEPVVDVVAASPVETNNGILVDELCRTNIEGIYACGDVANHFHPVFGRRLRIEHWQNARRQGRAAALNMLGKGQPYDEVHWFWSDQFDVNLQYAGHHTEWDELVVRGRIAERAFSAFYLKEGLMQAAVAMNRGAELRRSMPVIKARKLVDPALLKDETIDVRTLA